MLLIDQIAEQHIQAAIERGELEDLPGSGKPLNLDDDSQIPAELRAGYRLLKNANFIPPELKMRREIRNLEDLLEQLTDAPARNRTQARLTLLKAALEKRSKGESMVLQEALYRQKLVKKMCSE